MAVLTWRGCPALGEPAPVIVNRPLRLSKNGNTNLDSKELLGRLSENLGPFIEQGKKLVKQSSSCPEVHPIRVLSVRPVRAPYEPVHSKRIAQARDHLGTYERGLSALTQSIECRKFDPHLPT
jgi:hypothetical protein